MERKHWLVRLFDESNETVGIQLLKNLTAEEALTASASIIAGAHRGSYAEFGPQEATQVISFLLAKHGLVGITQTPIALPEDVFTESKCAVWIHASPVKTGDKVHAIAQETEEFLICAAFKYEEFGCKDTIGEKFLTDFPKTRYPERRLYGESDEIFNKEFPVFDEKILKPEGDGVNLFGLDGLDLSRFSKMKFIDMPAAEASDWLIRMLDVNSQIVSLSVLKGMREADARGWLTCILGAGSKWSMTELGSQEAIEVVNFALKKHGVEGKGEFAIGPMAKQGIKDKFIVMATIAENSDLQAIAAAVREGHLNMVAIMTPKSLLGK